MGALHKGHISLVERAQKDCGLIAVSIFVNPIQFGPQEDFKEYPRPARQDRKMLEDAGADLVFCPLPGGMYKQDFSTYVEEASLSKGLCGGSRPGHFRGVCTVVAKLFNIVRPDIAYFGQKDYQQAQVIKRMVRDLNFPITVKVLPIVRKSDGLAMSSRNVYLNEEERADSLVLHQALNVAEEMVRRGERDVARIIDRVKAVIKAKKTTRIDYVKIVDQENLNELRIIKDKAVLVLAVYAGKTRLIDNVILNARG
jgi:pantoate--beta-alanine ligase